MVAAVVFDMDGVIADTEHVWDEVREVLVADWGGTYSPDAQQAMMGMSSVEWSHYLEAARRLGIEPALCVAVEDSANGIRAAAAAGMWVIAYPNAHYRPEADALALADRVNTSLGELVAAVGSGPVRGHATGSA